MYLINMLKISHKLPTFNNRLYSTCLRNPIVFQTRSQEPDFRRKYKDAYNQIFKNVSNGISFKNTNLGIIRGEQKDSKLEYSNDECSISMIYCVSNITYNLYTRGVGYTYNPMTNIKNGWCLQTPDINDIWSITNKENVKFDYTDVVLRNIKEREVRVIDYVPCIDLEHMHSRSFYDQ